jgi:hypothetical protein
MKHHFSKVRNHHKFVVHGEEIYIEHRPRLKAFDLIYYPNKGRMFGQSQFYDKFVCRSFDFLSLVGVIIKAADAYSVSMEQIRFFEFLKKESSEFIMAEVLRKASCDTPAHSSKCAN